MTDARAFREVSKHHESLRRLGWEPTRWEHPTDGVSVRLPSGEWRTTDPNGDWVEYGGADGVITTYCAGGTVVEARAANGLPVRLRFGAAAREGR